jgi:hypothetical protein
MLNGWSSGASAGCKYRCKSSARKLARLIDLKYGRVVDAPQMIIC